MPYKDKHGNEYKFKDVQDVFDQHMGGRWFTYDHPLERDILIYSEVAVNYARGAQWMPASRHYMLGDWIVFCQGPNEEAEDHPDKNA